MSYEVSSWCEYLSVRPSFAATNSLLTESFFVLFLWTAGPHRLPGPLSPRPLFERSDPPEIRDLSLPSDASLSSSFRPRGDHVYIIH